MADSAQKNIEPVYDPDTGRLRQLRYDSDGNGKVDTVSYMDGARVLRIEIDKDEDGKVERWEYYDAARKLERVGLSRANDGVEDAWSYMGPDGKVSRVAISTRRDGSISRTEFYQADLPANAGIPSLMNGQGSLRTQVGQPHTTQRAIIGRKTSIPSSLSRSRTTFSCLDRVHSAYHGPLHTNRPATPLSGPWVTTTKVSRRRRPGQRLE